MLTIERDTVGTNGDLKAHFSAPLAGETVPTRVLVAPWGRVESTNGSFVVDDESARLAVAAFDAQATELPIDYEHQTLGGAYSSPTGQAPAAGWIKRLFAETGVGLLAEIEWTVQGRERLATKEYRYLSPVAIIRKVDRKLVALHSAALTNKPAVVGMEPIVNRGASPRFEASADPLTLLKAELELPDETAAEEVLAAASRRLIHLRQQATRQQVEDRVGEAMRAGKLVEAQRAWAEALVAREEGLFDEWFRTAPVIVERGLTAAPHSTDVANRGRQAAAARAWAEFASHRLLSALTTEEAYVADALRAAAR